jgi:hypothetical protein
VSFAQSNHATLITFVSRKAPHLARRSVMNSQCRFAARIIASCTDADVSKRFGPT